MAALGLLSAGSLAAQSSSNDWRFNGYYFSDGEEWFSLRSPTGEGEWFRKGAGGSIRVEEFDAERGLLTVVIDSRPHVLSIGRARIATGETPAPALDAPAVMTPAERFERLKIQAQARRIEREEIAREQGPVFNSVAGASVRDAKTASASEIASATPDAPIAEPSSTGSLSAEDWLAIHRRTAERRGVLEKKWAAEKLAWASGQSPARTSAR